MGVHTRKKCSPKRVLLLFAVASAFYAAYASLTAPLIASSSQVDRSLEEDNIRESVFRYRMAQLKTSGPFFLRIDRRDPTDSFMARFSKLDKHVKKASQSYFKKEPFPGLLRDRSTNEPGMLFSVGSINWLSSDRVEVQGGMYCGGLCGDVGTYRLERKGGLWVVIEFKVEAVS